jgi:oxygen-dependent protoporphyrinogen oxidase
MARVIVIGGGISGLATARQIQDLAPEAEVLVLESASRVGGCIQTESIDGFVMDGGASGFLNRDPSTLRLARDLGIQDDVISGCETMRRRYILARGALRRFPDSPMTFATSDLLSVSARARMLLEPMIPAGPAGVDETVQHFAVRRLGQEAADLLVDPVLTGIYAGDPTRMSVRATLPQLAALEDEKQSLLMAFIRSRGESGKVNGPSPSVMGTRRYVAFRGGIGQLVGSLEQSLGDRIVQGAPVMRVEREGSQWRVITGGADARHRIADVVVSAAPAPSANAYAGHLHPALAGACENVCYAPVVMVSLGYLEADVPHPLRGFGHLVPSCEKQRVLGVLWSTSIFPGERAPRGKVLFSAILGGMRDPEICNHDDESLVWEARKHLRLALGIQARPVVERIFRHRVGIPQYEVGHLRRVARAEASLLDLPGFFLTGNAFRGIGVNACTADAQRTGEAVFAYLHALSKMTARVPSMDHRVLLAS